MAGFFTIYFCEILLLVSWLLKVAAKKKAVFINEITAFSSLFITF